MLEALYTIMALMMAIKATGKDDLEGVVHHSDCGFHYCCDAYVALLNQYHITIRMTEDYRPTDNAIAERVNGILKTEVLYRLQRPKTLIGARKQIGDIITFYNERRPHMSIGYQTPSAVHQQSGEQQRHWKKYGEKICTNEEKAVSLHPQLSEVPEKGASPMEVDASTSIGQKSTQIVKSQLS